MHIAVVGTGYVGLVAGTCLAESGHTVVCLDVDEAKVAELRQGHIPIYEPGLEELVRRNVEAGRLEFSADREVLRGQQVIFLAVGTPQGADGAAELSYVEAAARTAAELADPDALIVLKSTVPVGTGDRVRAIVAEVRDDAHQIEVVNNPEFLREGSAVDDFLRPDRVVIGTDSERARKVMGKLYAPFVRTGNPILYMDPASAEVSKYAANALLATRISFMNDIARLCDAVSGDVELVRRVLGSDGRIGSSYLFPGMGFGGSCFPKDLDALVYTASQHGLDFPVVDGARLVNRAMKTVLVDRARKHFGEDLSGKTFAVWGLAFKPRTDDVREAPALALVEALLEAGATVRATDPAAIETARAFLGDRPGLSYFERGYDCAEGADALFLATEWSVYRAPDFDRLAEVMTGKVIFDGRNVLDPELVTERGFTYHGIGRRGM